eukprot:SAG25_NODE_28_length_20925_cov_13.342839_5_plen_95_part_00
MRGTSSSPSASTCSLALYTMIVLHPLIGRPVKKRVSHFFDWKDIIQNKEDPELVSPEKLRTAVTRLNALEQQAQGRYDQVLPLCRTAACTGRTA